MTSERSEHEVLIYGANGYTGRLVAKAAIRRGLTPILAGRHAQRVADLAREMQLPARIFDLSRPDLAARQLKGIFAVIHCAGPFSATAAPMLKLCIEAKCHYLDITGEIDVFEMVHRPSAQIAAAGITAVPGVGFDVVPTDCLAMMLKEALPDATHLTLAFDPRRSAPSVGTVKTMIEGLGDGARIRKEGAIVPLGGATRLRTIPFASGAAKSMAIPWGDVSTAFYSTGIPNIEVYAATSGTQLKMMQFMQIGRALLSLPFVRAFLKRQVEKRVRGPSDSVRAAGVTDLWGEARNALGRSVEISMQTPEGYTLTAEAAVLAVLKLMKGGVPLGAMTPSMAFGAAFITELDGVRVNFPRHS